MANFHCRSNSLPTQSHPIMESVQVSLCRLKSSEGASTSATFVCTNLGGLKDLHRDINDLVEMSSSQQGECWINELLEGSLRLVDLCSFSRDMLCLTKGAVQNLESSIRRNATAADMDAYMASRNKITKMVNKCIKNLKSFNQNSTAVPEKDDDLKAIQTVLKETESLDLSVLKSVLMLLSGQKRRSNQSKWSLLSKFTQTSRVHAEVEEESSDEDLCLNIHKSRKSMDSLTIKDMSKKLKAAEMMIQDLEEGLESLYRNLIKTRVSLLNVLSH